MKALRGTAAVAFAAIVAACGGGGDSGPTQPPVTATLGSIVPSSTTLNLAAGQQQTISVTAFDTNNQPISGATGFVFTSSAPAVVGLSSGGRVIGLTAGTATITVTLTLNGVSKSATVAVTVTGSLPAAATVSAGAANDFSPPTVAIARGGTVTWTFGAVIHNVEFGNTPGAPAGIGNSSNTSVARSFATAGTFSYTCTLHANMNGTVIVP